MLYTETLGFLGRTVLFLVTDGEYVTGQTICVTGGGWMLTGEPQMFDVHELTAERSTKVKGKRKSRKGR